MRNRIGRLSQGIGLQVADGAGPPILGVVRGLVGVFPVAEPPAREIPPMRFLAL